MNAERRYLLKVHRASVEADVLYLLKVHRASVEADVLYLYLGIDQCGKVSNTMDLNEFRKFDISLRCCSDLTQCLFVFFVGERCSV